MKYLRIETVDDTLYATRVEFYEDVLIGYDDDSDNEIGRVRLEDVKSIHAD